MLINHLLELKHIMKKIFYRFKNLFSNKFSYKTLTFILDSTFFIVIFLILEFFSISFPTHDLDSFHEGQKMSAA